jgi:hypothetical protein
MLDAVLLWEEQKLILKYLGLSLIYVLVEHKAKLQTDTEQFPRPAACYIGNLHLIHSYAL